VAQGGAKGGATGLSIGLAPLRHLAPPIGGAVAQSGAIARKGKWKFLKDNLSFAVGNGVN